jgi:hypothetical protein
MSYTNKDGIIINEPEKPLPEEGSITGGILAGLNNALLPVMPALKYSTSPGFFALKTLAQNYDPNLFNTESPTYRETKGFQSTVGDLFNPANLILGGVAGKALGAIGAFTSEAAQTALGITGSQVIGKTAATIAPKVLTGAAEGMGWTLLDHYERQAGQLNDELSNTNIALGAGFGGVLGLGAGIASRYLNKTDEQVGAQIANNVDTKLNTVTANADKQYNTQNKMGYDLSHELPPIDNRTTEKPMPPSTEEANYLPPIDEKTTGNVPTLNIKVPEISDETLAKLNLTRDSEIVKRDEKAILQAQRLDKHHKDLDSIDDSIVANKQHYSTKYNNILNDNPLGKHLSSGDDLSIRKAITAEHSELSEADIGTGDMVNGLNLTMFDDAQGLNIDRGFIQGYIGQNYNALQLAAITPEHYIQLMQETLKDFVDSATLRKSYEMLSNRDLEPTVMSVSSNPYKARVYNYKDAEAQLRVENELGTPQTIAAKVNSQIEKASDLHARVSVLGTENPQKTLNYFAKLKKVNPKTSENKIGSMLGLGKTYLDNDVLRLGGEVIRTATNTSKAVNVLFKPFSGILNGLGDITMVHMNAFANYGISKTLKAVMMDIPTEDIMALARLPKEYETWNGILKDFKHDLVNDTFEVMGIKIDNKLARFNKLASAAQVKLGGMHVLDKWVRQSNLKLIANVLKEEYKKNGLAKMFPGINKDILKEAVNKEGFLAPTKLTAKSDSFKADIDKVKNVKSLIWDKYNQNEVEFSKLVDNINLQNEHIKSAIAQKHNSTIDELKQHNKNINELKKQITDLKTNNPDLDEVNALSAEINHIKNKKYQAISELNAAKRKVATLERKKAFLQGKGNKKEEIGLVNESIAHGKATIEQIEKEIKVHDAKIKGFNEEVKNSFDTEKYDKLQQELIHERNLRDEALDNIKAFSKDYKSNKDLNATLSFVKENKFKNNKNLFNQLDELDKNIGDIKIKQQEYRDVATKLYTEYAKINRANPIFSNSNRWLQKLDPIVAHGARNVLWRLRMISGLYKSFLEGSNGTNKVLAFSGIAAASTAIALMEAAEKHALSYITGNEEYDQKVPLINKGLKETIPNSFIRNWAISSVNTMLPLSMFYNTPIVYGSGTKAARAAYHELAPENWGGNPEKAKQDLLQAMPYLGVMTNVWANHTSGSLEQQNENRAR